ncbi:hypothetical protein PENSPDRAFT_733174 [Peniophora sp. CONT]|nr:hypothetical protein PENSPDRAFT_733174 [Peniophora sp. CONT]
MSASPTSDNLAIISHETDLSSHSDRQNERLPPEILTVIFNHVFRLHIAYKFLRKAYDGKYREIPWSTLVAITGVCRFWREVALSKAEWWSCLPTHNISATELFIKRSQSYPLAFVVNTGFADRPLPLTRGRQQMLLSKEMMPRVKRLYWTFNTRDDKLQAPEQDLTPSVLPAARVHKLLGAFPAPQLEELCLDGPAIDLTEEAREEDGISAKIFTGVTPPKLHTLRIRHLYIHCSNPLLRANLRVLHLIDICDTFWLMDHLLETLAELPNLRELYMHCIQSADGWSSILSSPHSPSDHDKHLFLPNLRMLSLRDILSHITMILAFVHFPSTCCVHLDAKGFSNGSKTFKRVQLLGLAHILNAHYGENEDKGQFFRVVHCLPRAGEKDTMTLMGRHLCKDFTVPIGKDAILFDSRRGGLGGYLLRIEISWEDELDLPTVSTARIFFNEVHVLHGIRMLSLIADDTWLNATEPPPRLPASLPSYSLIFAAQREVRYLSLTHFTARAFLHSCRLRRSDDPTQLFPQLETLLISHAALTPLKGLAVKPLDPVSFAVMLADRVEDGNLKHLAVVGCTMSNPDIIALIKNAMGEGEDALSWDGRSLALKAGMTMGDGIVPVAVTEDSEDEDEGDSDNSWDEFDDEGEEDGENDLHLLGAGGGEDEEDEPDSDVDDENEEENSD